MYLYIYPEKKVLLHNHKNIFFKLTLKDFDARKSVVSLVHSNHTNTSEPQPSPATPWCGPLYPHQHQRAPAFASYTLMCSIFTTATSTSTTPHNHNKRDRRNNLFESIPPKRRCFWKMKYYFRWCGAKNCQEAEKRNKWLLMFHNNTDLTNMATTVEHCWVRFCLYEYATKRHQFCSSAVKNLAGKPDIYSLLLQFL